MINEEIKIKPRNKFLSEEDIDLIEQILTTTKITITLKEKLRLYMTIIRVNTLAMDKNNTSDN